MLYRWGARDRVYKWEGENKQNIWNSTAFVYWNWRALGMRWSRLKWMQHMSNWEWARSFGIVHFEAIEMYNVQMEFWAIPHSTQRISTYLSLSPPRSLSCHSPSLSLPRSLFHSVNQPNEHVLTQDHKNIVKQSASPQIQSCRGLENEWCVFRSIFEKIQIKLINRLMKEQNKRTTQNTQNTHNNNSGNNNTSHNNTNNEW